MVGGNYTAGFCLLIRTCISRLPKPLCMSSFRLELERLSACLRSADFGGFEGPEITIFLSVWEFLALISRYFVRGLEICNPTCFGGRF